MYGYFKGDNMELAKSSKDFFIFFVIWSDVLPKKTWVLGLGSGPDPNDFINLEYVFLSKITISKRIR